MKAKFFIYDRQVSKKEAAEKYGKEKLERRIQEAVESFLDDPNEQISWADGLIIEF